MAFKARSPAVAAMSAEQRRDACRQYVDLLLNLPGGGGAKAAGALRNAARTLGKTVEDVLVDACVVDRLCEWLDQIERGRAAKAALTKALARLELASDATLN